MTLPWMAFFCCARRSDSCKVLKWRVTWSHGGGVDFVIHDVFRCLREALVAHVQLATGVGAGDAAQDPILFPGADKVESLDVKLGAVTMFLVNIEEDRRVRPADPFRRVLADGTIVAISAPVPLNLYILFVARFNDYLESLKHVGLIARFFQEYRVISHENLPTLGVGIDTLTTELITTPITEDNHIWKTLGTPYHPSLLYRVKMVVVQAADGPVVPKVAAPPSIEAREIPKATHTSNPQPPTPT